MDAGFPTSLTLLLRCPDSQIQTLALDPFRTLTLADLKLSLSLHPSSSFFFTHNGRALPDSTRLPHPLIPPLSTLALCPRLLGGGGDGGATGAESRDCYLNMYAERKPDKVDPNEKRLSKWLNCAVSGEPLAPPCVIDRLGNVFNKEALVEALITRRLPRGFGHIKGLKDMIDVCLEPVSDKDGRSGVRFQCPVTGSEFNGKYRFFALRKCGHVLSAKALKEVKSSACLVCHKEFEQGDTIVINGNEEDVAALRARMEEDRAKGKEKKAAKKGKNGEVGIVGLEVENEAQLSGKKHGIVDANGMEEKVNGKVEPNGKIEVAKGRGNGSSSAKRFKAVDIAPAHANKEVYASIFTSSRKSEFKETYSCRSLPLGRN